MTRSRDHKGTLVTVGTQVRVLSVPSSVLSYLSQVEAARVKSMVGEVLEVYEIDAYGSAWVQKWWHDSAEEADSHSLALSPQEMEVVPDGSAS